MLSADQVNANRVAEIFKKSKHDKRKYFYSHPFLSEALKIDHFDPSVRMELNQANLVNCKTGDYLIWENWFAVTESGLTRETLEKNHRLIKVKEFTEKDSNRESIFIVYIAD